MTGSGVSADSELTENVAEALKDSLLPLRHLPPASQLALQVGHPVPADTTGRDAVEPGEVRGDVQGEAVGGDPTRGKLHSDGCDLLLPYPYPRVLRMRPALDPVVLQDPDNDPLQPPQVAVRVAVA